MSVCASVWHRAELFVFQVHLELHLYQITYINHLLDLYRLVIWCVRVCAWVYVCV